MILNTAIILIILIAPFRYIRFQCDTGKYSIKEWIKAELEMILQKLR